MVLLPCGWWASIGVALEMALQVVGSSLTSSYRPTETTGWVAAHIDDSAMHICDQIKPDIYRCYQKQCVQQLSMVNVCACVYVRVCNR